MPAGPGNLNINPDGSVSANIFSRPGNPAAATEISFPAGGNRVLLSISATLVTSVTVGNRTPTLTIQSGGTTLWSGLAAPAQAASLTTTYFWSPTLPVTAANAATVLVPIPLNLIIPNGASIVTSSTLLAADQWSNINIAMSGP